MSLNDYLIKRDVKKVNYSIDDLFNEVDIEKDSTDGKKFFKHIRKTIRHSSQHILPTHVSCRTARNIICSWLTE